MGRSGPQIARDLLEKRHQWTPESEYAPHYVAALRQALDGPVNGLARVTDNKDG
jgi:hypothetical protein